MNDIQILVSTVLGALLVVVAIWLIAVRRDPARNTMRFFGIELDLSTPGVIVLAAGCGLLVLPAFVPYRPGAPLIISFDGDPSPDGGAVMRRTVVLTDEQEPNDSIGFANLIQLGQTISGTLDGEVDPFDYFALETTPETRGPKRMIMRTRGSFGCCARLTVWNEKEQKIGGTSGLSNATLSAPAQPATIYYVRLSLPNSTLSYEFLITNEQ